VLIIFTKGESSSTVDSLQASTMIRSNGVKVVTVYVGSETSAGFMEERQIVTDTGELAGLRVDRVDLLINQNETNLLQRAVDIPAPIMGQSCRRIRIYVISSETERQPV